MTRREDGEQPPHPYGHAAQRTAAPAARKGGAPPSQCEALAGAALRRQRRAAASLRITGRQRGQPPLAALLYSTLTPALHALALWARQEGEATTTVNGMNVDGARHTADAPSMQ